MTDCCVVITTTDTSELARTIANHLVDSRFAKCVQLSKIESIYEWQGKIEDAVEYRLMIKAHSKHVANIESAIISLHSYSVPEIIVLDISGGNKKYLEWISSE